jgi:hypothetical protein
LALKMQNLWAGTKMKLAELDRRFFVNPCLRSYAAHSHIHVSHPHRHISHEVCIESLLRLNIHPAYSVKRWSQEKLSSCLGAWECFACKPANF